MARKKQHVLLRFKYTILLAVSAVVLISIADTEMVRFFVARVGEYGYVGIAATGVFFVSTFTVVPASILLFHLARLFDPLMIAIIAGMGAAIGDLFLFSLLKDGVFEEWRPLFDHARVLSVFRTRSFSWIAPFVGALIIVLPFPDEIGIGLMGLSNIKPWQFVLLVFVLNAAGIFAIITLAGAL